MLTDVERVKVLAQYHEHASVLRIFFGDYSAEHIAIEPLRDLLVGDPQIDVTDAFQSYVCGAHTAIPTRSDRELARAIAI
jgi:hypothetical protein